MMLIVSLTAAVGFLITAACSTPASILYGCGIQWPALSPTSRRTVWPLVGIAILFSLAGAAMQAYAPGAKSIGQVIQYKKIAR
jgi:hypothetical protein